MTKMLSVRLHKVQAGVRILDYYNLTDKFERGNVGII